MPRHVKLFCGFIYSDESLKEQAIACLCKRLGKTDFESAVADFDSFTSYYNPEMGTGLKRSWASFEKLIFPDEIASIKVFANDVENSFAKDLKRRINIDPGYISPANVILASTKDFSHRIYLSEGIYAEVTTIYKKEGFVKLPWSYPDYMSKTAQEFLLTVRKSLLDSLK